jgi:hypothetical protein
VNYLNVLFLNMSFEAFTAVMFQIEVFCVVTLCSVVIGYRLFKDPYRLHLQGEGVTTRKI